MANLEQSLPVHFSIFLPSVTSKPWSKIQDQRSVPELIRKNLRDISSVTCDRRFVRFEHLQRHKRIRE